MGAGRTWHRARRAQRRAAPARPPLRPGHLHGQPRHHRRHDGEQLRGARSVLYGKTIDHVLEQRVVLSDGSQRVVSRAHRHRARGRQRGRHARSRQLPRRCGASSANARTRSNAGFPKVLRRVGGYNLDAFVRDGEPFNMAKLMVGSEGTLGVVLEAKISLVPLPNAKAVLAIQFADLLEALEATPAILAHGPSAVEVMDRFILDHTKQSAALDRLRQTFVEGDPARTAVCRVLCGSSRRPAAQAGRACSRSHRPALRVIAIIARRRPRHRVRFGRSAKRHWACRWP